MKKQPRHQPAALSLLQDIEQREALNPQFYYDAKKPSIRFLRKHGFDDAAIERLLHLTLKEEDRAAPA
jgi:hypothetical protein